MVASLVSGRYDHGAENLEGLRTLEVLTPFSVAEILESLPSVLLASRSPVHVTTVLEGSTTVLQPRLPADVANSSADAGAGIASCEMANREAARASRRVVVGRADGNGMEVSCRWPAGVIAVCDALLGRFSDSGKALCRAMHPSASLSR